MTTIISLLGRKDYSPIEAYKIATKIVHGAPELLSEVIFWRWETALERGVINFDPRDPRSYKEVEIGPYIKRIIPDRTKPETEKFSDSLTPVFLPFNKKYPNNFDFTMAKLGQKLLSIFIENIWFDIYASNSPLASVPHTLLVPRELRSQFLLPIDLRIISILRERYPQFHFIYSSMGAGAGVNHQHWHMMVGQCEYPVIRRSITNIYMDENTNIGHYPEWPTDCIVVESLNDYKMEIEMEFIDFLQKNNVPHNVFVSKNRSWITPRSHINSKLIPEKKYGAWEVILGICNTGSQEQYDFVNVNILEQALREIQLTPNVKKEIIKKIELLAISVRGNKSN